MKLRFINQFAVGRNIAVEGGLAENFVFFDTAAEASAFALNHPDTHTNAGGVNIGGEIIIFAGGTNPIRSPIEMRGGSFGSLRLDSPAQGVEFTIFHELGHIQGYDSEGEANCFAMSRIGRRC